MTLLEMMPWVENGILYGDSNTQILGVSTDSRSIVVGDLFVALKGEKFDGNRYLETAKIAGASAAITSENLTDFNFSGIQVNDTKIALGQIATAWRAKFNLPLIAITGSNGKTTVTQMVASILRAYKGEGAISTKGNLNNDIGVPMTLFQLTKRTEIGVIELGMNHPGEIEYLAAIAQPTIALVNNAQREHMEFMGSVHAVAKENGGILTTLPNDGVAVFPSDDAYSGLWLGMAKNRKVVMFSIEAEAGIRNNVSEHIYCDAHEWAENKWTVSVKSPLGKISYQLHIAGLHNVKNSLAAIACAYAAGVPKEFIEQGLQNFRPVGGRSHLMHFEMQGKNISLIDDTYNANPDSMQEAVNVLAVMPGYRLLVLGDMGEVGNEGEQFHKELGEYIKYKPIDRLFTLGEMANYVAVTSEKGEHFHSVDTLKEAVLSQIAVKESISILIKGSRFMKMERIVECILNRAAVKKDEIYAS
ncbi:MAG TPA: UDP-N-acetylmuramoyl-tripeptide--D-alanyl-D-alanine ligase [Burkholderiaceae bacterium]|nr:UDP-N-acetylmuramoyl-tripeptide--D-alanyl-D-alanine ligase [Burkholderiaceae bacterium]